MKRNTKLLLAAVAVVVAVAVLVLVFQSVSGNLDVVGKQSITSFDTILKAIPDQVKADDANGGWSLTAPDGTVRFIWSKDYSKSGLHDVMLELDVQPFVDAGLDVGKLPANYAAYEGMLMVGTKLGNDEFQYNGTATPLASYEQLVNKYRSTLNYHTALDHYGVKLGDGNMFEWAKDRTKNTTTGKDQDKDIVFVLNPEPLIAAGVDPAKVTGWVYAQVAVEENGKTIQVYKFLKPFNLV
jgi:hypothetical protein